MRIALPLAVVLVAALPAAAQAPSALAFQGVLEDGGVPVADGTHAVTVRLFDAAAGGSALYAEDHTVTTAAGVFALPIGDGAPTAGAFADVPFTEAVWVEVAVGGTTLAPRTALQAVPYARSLSAPAAIAGDAPDGAAVLVENTAASGAFGNGLTVVGASVGTSRALNAWTAAPNGTGVYGHATSASDQTYGVYGLANSTAGFGVYGLADAASGFTAGVYGDAASTIGSGVVGRSTAASGAAKGVYGEAASGAGAGVWGANLATTGAAYGVYGETASPTGLAIYGHNLSTTGFAHGGYARTESAQGVAFVGRAASTAAGTTVGVQGESNAPGGRGVYGWATAASGAGWGVYGQSSSSTGRGVFGWAPAGSGITTGVYGAATSTAGRGVVGQATAASGETVGVYGTATSPDGRAGYFLKAVDDSELQREHHVAEVHNDLGGDVLALTTSVFPPQSTENYVTFFAPAGGGGFQAIAAIEGNGSGGVAYKTSGADYAEWLPYADATRPARPADVVGVRGGRVSLAAAGAEQVLVVSSRPAVIGNAREGVDGPDTGALVALVGQAEVRVAGPASAGDLLVASGRDDGTARAVAPTAYDPEADGPVAGRVLSLSEAGRAVALVGVDEAAALRAVVARQAAEIAALRTAQIEQRALLEALLVRLGDPASLTTP